MYAFPCSACGSSTALERVHSWSAGRPACSASCAETLRASRVVPSLEVAVEGALGLLEETSGAVERAAKSAGTAGAATVAAGVLEFGGEVMRTIADIAANQAICVADTDLWELDRRLHHLLARMMLLEELGLPVARELGPLVHRFGGLAGAPPAGLGPHLRALCDYLVYLHGGIQTLGAPPPYR